MAPQMKRPAAAVSKGPGKKAKISPEVEAVADAIKAAEAIPSALREVLSVAAQQCLTVYKSDRHEFQNVYVDQIGAVLEGVKVSIDEEVAKYQATVDGSDKMKADLTTAEKELTATVEKLKVELVEAKAASAADATAVKELKAALIATCKAKDEGDVDVVKAEGNKAALVKAKTDLFLPMKENAAEAKALKELVKVGQTFGFDDSMLSSAQTVLNVAPSSRQTFAAMVVTQIEEAFNKKIAAFTSQIEELTPAKNERQSAVDAKQAELTAAEAKAAASKDASEKASVALAECEIDLAAKQKAAKAFLPDLKKAADTLDAALAKQKVFTESVLNPFLELKELAPPAEPVPEPAAAPEPVAVPEPVVEAAPPMGTQA